MAINHDPSVLQQDHHDSVPNVKRLGQGKSSENLHEKLASLREEREWVDALLACSQHDEKFDAVVNSLNWDEASVGWKPARPNATYITRVADPNSKRDAEKEKDKENSKHKNSQRLISFESDLSWKHCVEPGTYRYVHKSAYAGIPKKKTFNKGPVKRPVDPILQDHIRKVKEHLEKVLVQQASPKVQQRPLGSIHNHGDYVASLIREANPMRHQPHLDTTCSPWPSDVLTNKDSPTHTKVPDVGLTYTIKQSSPRQKSPLPHRHHPPSHPENKSPNDLVTALGFKLNELIQQDKFKGRIRTTKHPKHKPDEKLGASYEKFSIPAQVESPTLNPLVKVTPSQRRIYDDNELIGAVAKMNRQADERLFSCNSSPTPSQENHLTTQYEATSMREDVQSPKYDRFQRFDQVNGNFFTCGVSGKAVTPSDVEVRVRNVANMSSILGANPAKVKKRGTLYPQKAQGRPVPLVAGRGDHRFSVTNRLGDPLHRGVVDREVAGAIASELLPGVNGHKIRFPLQQAYHIV